MILYTTGHRDLGYGLGYAAAEGRVQDSGLVGALGWLSRSKHGFRVSGLHRHWPWLPQESPSGLEFKKGA